MLDAPDPDGVVDRFISDEPNKEALSSLADLIDEFRESQPEGARLESALHADLWCEFVLSAAGMSARDWLRTVSARLRAAAQR